jgi:integrase
VATGKVTKTTVENLSAPKEGKAVLWDKQVAGFGVYVTPRGARVYILQYRMGGRGYPTRRYTIGRHGSPWSAERARERARELLYQVYQGTDPLLKEQQARTAAQVDEKLRFSNYIETFDRLYLQTRNLRSAPSVLQHLRLFALPTFGNRPITTITRQQIVALMDQLTERSRGTANHTFSALSAMMSFALQRSDIDHNPFSGLKKPHKFQRRQRVLSDWEILRVWEAAHDIGFPEGAAIQMLLLTGQRLKEVSRALWDEMDLRDYFWKLPPERTKNKRPHIVPITERMLRFFDEHWPAEARSGHLFLGPRGKPFNSFHLMKLRLNAYVDRRVALANANLPQGTGSSVGDFVLHDLRRTAATGIRALGEPLEHVEALLNHREIRSELVETYQVYDLASEKQIALAKWHKHIEGLTQRGDAWPGGKELPPLDVPTRKSK